MSKKHELKVINPKTDEPFKEKDFPSFQGSLSVIISQDVYEWLMLHDTIRDNKGRITFVCNNVKYLYNGVFVEKPVLKGNYKKIVIPKNEIITEKVKNNFLDDIDDLFFKILKKEITVEVSKGGFKKIKEIIKDFEAIGKDYISAELFSAFTGKVKLIVRSKEDFEEPQRSISHCNRDDYYAQRHHSGSHGSSVCAS